MPLPGEMGMFHKPLNAAGNGVLTSASGKELNHNTKGTKQARRALFQGIPLLLFHVLLAALHGESSTLPSVKSTPAWHKMPCTAHEFYPNEVAGIIGKTPPACFPQFLPPRGITSSPELPHPIPLQPFPSRASLLSLWRRESVNSRT